MSTPLAMLHPKLLDPKDIQAISRDGLIMALNRKVDLLTRKVARRHNPTLRQAASCSQCEPAAGQLPSNGDRIWLSLYR
jgi:hypothetical protein